MEWMWLIPLNVALLLVPAMFGVWAWSEVIERIREDHAAVGRRSRALRLALVMTSATYLVGGGTWIHPAMIGYILTTTLTQRMLLYSLVAVPWIGFGVIGLLARGGRRTGLRGFMQERDRHERRISTANERSRAFLHAIGMELETALHRIESRIEHMQRQTPAPAGTHPPPDPANVADALDGLNHLAEALRVSVPTDPVDVALDDLLAEGLENVRPLADERGVSLFRSGRESCRVTAGPDRLRQVLQVLLEGAMERAPREEGIVVLRIEDRPDGRLLLTLRDNGPPPTRTDLAVAFALDPEQRMGAPVMPGLGFPLALARRLARQDDGDVTIAPADDGGTVVALTLPTGAPARSRAEGRPAYART